MERKGKFYYSEKARRRSIEMAHQGLSQHRDNYCIIDGVEHVYTEWCDSGNPVTKWDDLVYLGEGTYGGCRNIIGEDPHRDEMMRMMLRPVFEPRSLSFVKSTFTGGSDEEEWPSIIGD